MMMKTMGLGVFEVFMSLGMLVKMQDSRVSSTLFSKILKILLFPYLVDGVGLSNFVRISWTTNLPDALLKPDWTGAWVLGSQLALTPF
jgi:hypothetical protein